MLLLLAAALYALYWRKFDPKVIWLGLGVVGAFIMFSALIRWGPWNARYHLPLFLLSASFIAAVFARTLSPKWLGVLSCGLLILSLPLALRNSSRPLITRHGLEGGVLALPRSTTYFLDQHRELAESFIATARFVKGQSCSSVGIDANRLRFEYPMFALLTEDGRFRNLTYSSVQNSTTRYAPPGEKAPCLVICLGCAHVPEKWEEYRARARESYQFGDQVVFRTEKSAHADGGSNSEASAVGRF